MIGFFCNRSLYRYEFILWFVRIVETHTKPASSSCFFTKNTRGVGLQSSPFSWLVFSLDTLFAAGNFFSLICGKPSVVPSPILYSQKWFASDALARREKRRKKRRLSPAANCRFSFVFALFCGKIRRASIIVSPFLNGRKGEEDDFPLFWRAFVPIPFVNSHVFTCPWGGKTVAQRNVFLPTSFDIPIFLQNRERLNIQRRLCPNSKSRKLTNTIDSSANWCFPDSPCPCDKEVFSLPHLIVCQENG